MAPTSRFEKPSMRVYSSPKPTQPDSRTIGELSARPQKSTRSGPEFDDSTSFAAAFMGRALYEARPMQTQAPRVLVLAALAAASTLAAAQSPAPANPAASGPSFSLSDDIPNPKGYGDAYSLNEIRLGGQVYTEDQQIERWQAELKTGRARAGALLGAYLAYRALPSSSALVAAARAAATRADELGS